MKNPGKHIFNRASAVLFAIVMIAVCAALGGCNNSKANVKAYTYVDELGGQYIIEYTYDGDAIIKLYQVYTLDYSEIDKSIEEVLQSKAESAAKSYEEVDYVKYQYSLKKEVFKEKVTIRDIGDHVEEISEKRLMPEDAVSDDGYMSLEKVEKVLLESGWQHAE